MRRTNTYTGMGVQLEEEREAAREGRELQVPQIRTLALGSFLCCHGRCVQYLGIFGSHGARWKNHKISIMGWQEDGPRGESSLREGHRPGLEALSVQADHHACPGVSAHDSVWS